jgi:hypothetical protein
MRRATALLVLVLLVLSSCGGDDDTVGTGASSSSSSSSTTSTAVGADPTTPPPMPAGEGDDPADPSTPASRGVIRISVGGGFSPYGTDFAAVPTLVLADGTAFTGGATTMQYPGPAIAPVSTGALSSAQVASLLDAAKAAGLTTTRDYGQPGITDVGTTTIRVVLDGTTHTAAVYALGYEDGAGGLTAEQRTAREKVSAFVAEVGDAVSAAATGTFAPTAYQVLATPSQPASSHPDPKPNQLDWPVPSKPLAAGPCRDLTGDDAAAFRGALAKATQITVWRSGGKDWQVVARATLPGDAPCK